MKKYGYVTGCALFLALLLPGNAVAQLQGTDLLNEPTDISPDYTNFKNTYYFADELVSFDPGTVTGTIRYRRYEYSTRIAFNNMLAVLNPVNANEFPGTWIDYQTGKEYAGGWHYIKAGGIPVVVLVKDGTVIPHIELAQSTKSMDWANI